MHFHKYYLIVYSLTAIGQFAFGQHETAGKTNTTTYGAGLHYGSIFAHSEAVQNTAGANPIGLELQWMRQRNDSIAYNTCHCYPRQGLVVSAYSFDNRVLGNSINAAYLLEPNYKLGKKVFLSMRGAIGLAFGSNPYHPEHNPGNQSYSTAISAYLLYGLGVKWLVTSNSAIELNGNFQHISNGGFKQPNKGVNWPTIGLQYVHYTNNFSPYNGMRKKDTSWKKNGWRKDLVLSGMAGRFVGNTTGNSREPIVGLTAQTGKQVGNINHLTIGMEILYDGVLKKKIEEDGGTQSPVLTSVVGGHEFLLGRYRFSQQIGVYLGNHQPYYGTWYHRWGLSYAFSKQVLAGFSLKAHKQVANFVDLRLQFSWPGKVKH